MIEETIKFILTDIRMGAVVIIAFALLVTVLSAISVFRYRNHTIPMNSFMFVMMGLAGISNALYYYTVAKAARLAGGLQPVHTDLLYSSRVRQIITLSVFIFIAVSALAVRYNPCEESEQEEKKSK